ncbi:MAG: hypothetical protein Q7S43_04310 [bacterium]|nr:hypothetical protein [bacterium]
MGKPLPLLPLFLSLSVGSIASGLIAIFITKSGNEKFWFNLSIIFAIIFVVMYLASTLIK